MNRRGKQALTNSPSVIDFGIVPLLLLGILFLQMVVAGSVGYFQHRFWLDEFHTYYLVNDPDLWHSLRALCQGADFSPPGLFLLMRPFCAIMGGADETSLRVFSFLSVYLGLVGLYLILTRSFSRIACFATVLAVWTHHLVMANAFEARFYGPLFALSIWYGYFLETAASTQRMKFPAYIGVAVIASMLCLIHWFGCFSLLIVTVAHILQNRRRKSAFLPALVAILAGSISLLCCASVYLGQRTVLGSVTWIPDLDIVVAKGMFLAIFLEAEFSVVVLFLYFGSTVAVRLGWNHPDGVEDERKSLGPVIPTFSLAMVPVALILFSLIVQPATMPRYAIAGVASFGPVVCLLLSRMSRPFQWIAVLCFIVLGTGRLHSSYSSDSTSCSVITGWWDSEQLVGIDESLLFVFDSRGPLFDYAYYSDQSGRQTALLELDISAPDGSEEGRFSWVQCRIEQQMAETYNMPSVVKIDELRDRPVFYFITARWTEEMRENLVGFEMTPVTTKRSGPKVFEVRPMK